jgi:hypothetical protein
MARGPRQPTCAESSWPELEENCPQNSCDRRDHDQHGQNSPIALADIVYISGKGRSARAADGVIEHEGADYYPQGRPIPLAVQSRTTSWTTVSRSPLLAAAINTLRRDTRVSASALTRRIRPAKPREDPTPARSRLMASNKTRGTYQTEALAPRSPRFWRCAFADRTTNTSAIGSATGKREIVFSQLDHDRTTTSA